MIEVMSPATTNPVLLEFGLCDNFKWNPQILEDQIVELPPFKKVLKWIFFGKPLKVLLRKGLEATKVEEFLAILNEIRIQQDEKQRQVEREAKLRGRMH